MSFPRFWYMPPPKTCHALQCQTAGTNRSEPSRHPGWSSSFRLTDQPGNYSILGHKSVYQNAAMAMSSATAWACRLLTVSMKASRRSFTSRALLEYYLSFFLAEAEGLLDRARFAILADRYPYGVPDIE